jgi:hypothetical protein
MSKHSHVFGWDEEPVDERPSEFMASTGYSVLSGYHPLPDDNQAPRRRRAPSRFGLKTLLVCCAVLLALGAYALLKLAPLLRG